MTTLLREAGRLASDRVCFVCRAPVSEGVYHADLGLRSHLGACAEQVAAERRVYDRSRRGRWRRRSDVLANLWLRRQGETLTR